MEFANILCSLFIFFFRTNTLNAFRLEFANILSSLFILFFREIGEAFNLLGKDPDCRVIILSGNGKAFCAGIALNDLMALGSVVNDNEHCSLNSYKLYVLPNCV